MYADAGLELKLSVFQVEEFQNAQGELDVKVGDVVNVALDAVEDGFGESNFHVKKRMSRILD